MIRLSKKALQEAGVALSEAERAQRLGVISATLVREGMDKAPRLEGKTSTPTQTAALNSKSSTAATAESASNAAEGGLQSEEPELERQAQHSRPLDTGTNLLAPSPGNQPG